MALNPFTRRDNPYLLVVSMTGVKMGDRLVQLGCAPGGRLAAIAGIVGLSGRAVAIVLDEASATRARKGAESAGVLVEIETAETTTRIPGDAGAFDLAVIDDTAGLLANMRPENRVATLREVARVLRPGGRAVLIGAAPRGGLGALLTRAQSGPPFVSSGQALLALEAEGFKSPRVLAEREGLIFVEGMKPRDVTG
jgi:SAM-dependent methyltransferase